MSAMPSPVQADFPGGSLPLRGPMESSTLNPGDLEDDPYAGAGEHQAVRATKKRRSGSTLRTLITFCLGVGGTVAWYSFGDPLRETIANASPQLAWIAPQSAAQPASDSTTPAAPSLDQQLISAASVDIDAVRQNVDRIAASQEQIIRSIGQLTTGQELLTKEITKLQAVEQYILYKNSEPPPTRSASPAPAPVRRPAAPLPLTPAPAPQASQAAPPATR